MEGNQRKLYIGDSMFESQRESTYREKGGLIKRRTRATQLLVTVWNLSGRPTTIPVPPNKYCIMYYYLIKIMYTMKKVN